MPAIGRQAEEIIQLGKSEFLNNIYGKEGTISCKDIAFAALHGDRASIELIKSVGSYIGKFLQSLLIFITLQLLFLEEDWSILVIFYWLLSKKTVYV